VDDNSVDDTAVDDAAAGTERNAAAPQRAARGAAG
jgi:hypothetical protein